MEIFKQKRLDCIWAIYVDLKLDQAQCINNLKAVLEAAGTKIENVVKVNVFLG